MSYYNDYYKEILQQSEKIYKTRNGKENNISGNANPKVQYTLKKSIL